MDAQTLTFTANEQVLTKTDSMTEFASNTVSYIEATFTLGTNWTGYDAVRAVWKTDYYTISTVLDGNYTCVVPTEVLMYKAKVYVNLVGSITSGDTLTDRLTTFPVLALTVTQKAQVDSTETATVTASQFDQFVATIQTEAASIQNYSHDSEAWAVGTRGGVAVTSGDDTYENNSKYWAQEAASELSDLKDDLSESVSEITGKMTKVSSNNYAKTGALTSGYVDQNGTIYTSSSLCYTEKIEVSEGDVIRIYGTVSSFSQKDMRFVCAYDASNNAISASGAEAVQSYTVPQGIASIVISLGYATSDISQIMVTKDYEATQYEAYYTPYYVAAGGFVDASVISAEVVKGYNLLHAFEEGDGFYDKNASNKAQKYTYSGYKYAIIPISKNTNYYISGSTRTLLLTDDSGNVLTYFGSGITPRRLVNSGNATRMYFTAASEGFNNVNTIVAEGLNGVRGLVKKPSFVSGLTQRMSLAKYGNALPKMPLYFTNGLSETWYYKNMMALKNNIPNVFFTYYSAFSNKGISITPQTRGLVSDGYGYAIYDENFALVDNKRRAEATYKADNLQNASVLVIGDSTVNQNYMTQYMLDGFATRSKTLTLLGTRGTAPNNHEGRSGWSTYDYCTQASKGSWTNPFFNTSTSKFDFSYYMTSQGYSAPDFVIVQLGINDLYSAGADLATDEDVQTAINQTADYIVEMIESILAYNSSQKILLNLPTAVNEDMSQHTRFMPLVRNTFIRYNEYIQMLTSTYPVSNVRCTYCHLILDPEEDILNDVHPTTGGYEKMANEVISQINCWQN